MSHFAKVENGIVTQVLVIEQEDIDMGHWGEPSLWIKTSYNTHNGVHYGPDGQPDGGVALRGNYAGKGMVYDATHDVFYEKQPHPSWTLNQTTWSWEAPIPMPTDEHYYEWDETQGNWVIKE